MKYTIDASKLRTVEKGKLNISELNCDIEINNIYVEKANMPWYMITGEFHYSRYSADLWEEEILKMKAGGINVIATYLFWNHHEYVRGQWNFNGDMDIRRFIELCEKHDMLVILRVGPYCHGEVVLGGLPKYVYNYPLKRTNSPKYLGWVKELYTRYYNEVKEHIYANGNGGCIIGLQVDNEYTGGYEHILNIRDIAINVGFKLPIYTVTAWSGPLSEGKLLPLSGTYPEAPWEQSLKPLDNGNRFKIMKVFLDDTVGNDSIDPESSNAPEKYKIMTQTPYGMCELGAGVQCTAHRRPIISTSDAYSLSMISIAKGMNILGYYIYHGGRNPNFAPMQETRRTLYPNNLPFLTYDFQAPIGEYGYPKEKYYYLRLLHYFCNTFDASFPTMQSFVMSNDYFKNGDDKFSSSVRINEFNEGYFFLNTYERRVKDNCADNIEPVIKVKDNTINLPKMSMTNGESFFYPFNITIGNVKFDYITAQPLLKYTNGNTTHYIFFKHKDIDACFSANTEVSYANSSTKSAKGKLKCANGEVLRIEDKGHKYVISLYDKETALHINYSPIENNIYISNNFVYYDDKNKYEIVTTKANLSKYIKVESVPKKRMKYDTFFYGRHKLQSYRLTIDKNIYNVVDDAIISFNTNADMAHIYCDNSIVADYMNCNNDFSIAINRMKNEILAGKTFTIRTRAIRKNQHTYYEIPMITGDSSITGIKTQSIKKTITKIK